MERDSPVRVDVLADIVTITLDRPETLNALDYPTTLALRLAIDEAAAVPGARAVVLRGAGNGFCCGGDVAAMHAHRADLPGFIERMIDAFHASILALNRLPLPVIAAVHGAVAGGGLSLALACDFVVAAGNTRFVTAYARLGASSDGGLSFRLVQRLGAVRALDALMLHDSMDANQALALGLVNRVVDEPTADVQARGWALELGALAPAAVRELKQLVAAQSIDALEAQLAREKSAFLRCAGTPEFAQRVAAFATGAARSDPRAGLA